ncbi:hypothetical protein SARC_01447 [Sphaeroforma arctica JP610]|uniref:Glycoside-hydrolase family GH114 TIM-barrel domain-containing protein n=1 Tax=Sphaeroforma arctica JP610 TaxID=667725 RepID=A0A0L0GBK2_9EUKA|nr:hypothetical protein SARC_01447 [Sphaeroforma arctica JP610]KNC86397.1 hypothetical protein SARC_01447 [Sphaeroforma arctica JP610]|eukprot:XP_014160299.1 hypothetical protein SARC_01447 [Sphaeroforma arctica JP610]
MVNKMNTLLLPLAACAVVQSVPTTTSIKEVTPIPSGVTWSLMAWGGEDDEKGYVIDVDVFETSEERIAQLKDDSHYGLCYIDVGTAEKWRPDYEQLKPYTVGKPQYEEEDWMDIEILAKDKGCDGVEIDNSDAYAAPLAMKDRFKKDLISREIVYMQWLSNAAHGLGMSIGLKNSMEISKNVHQMFEFAINKSCNQFDECKYYAPFQDAGKAIFNVEYKGEQCKSAAKWGMTKKYVEQGHLINC